MTIGIHIFRKDLRVIDNLALAELANTVDHIIPLFILDPKQIKKTNRNKYYHSDHAVQFICESIQDLYKQTREALILLSDDPIVVISEMIDSLKKDKHDITHIAFNADFTKYATERDTKIRNMATSKHVQVIESKDDQSLIPVELLCKSDKQPYMVYGSFAKNHKKHTVSDVIRQRIRWWNTTESDTKAIQKSLSRLNVWDINDIDSLYTHNPDLAMKGGRTSALKRLEVVDKKIPGLPKLDGFKDRDNITKRSFEISAHMNFGCISIREMYHRYKKEQDVINQLIWRDFYLAILVYNPSSREYTFLDDRFKKIKWKPNKDEWKTLINAKTGFLLIDAAMVQLKQTGYIGGRMRLLLGTFWCKYLLTSPFDPEYGSHVGFSKYLVDCITSQNKFNHQWLTSELDLNGRRFHKKGCSSLTGRMIRIDNQIIKKYDKDGEYIKRWLPHLKDMSVKDMSKHQTIFDWETRYQQYCKLLSNIE